jgi:hypothetical protein
MVRRIAGRAGDGDGEEGRVETREWRQERGGWAGRVPCGPTRQTCWHMLLDGGGFWADAPGGEQRLERDVSNKIAVEFPIPLC